MLSPAAQPPGANRLIYQITVKGRLTGQWSDWFGGMDITTQTQPDGSTITRLTGPIQDQAALRGILIKLLDLNLVLVAVQQIE